MIWWSWLVMLFLPRLRSMYIPLSPPLVRGWSDRVESSSLGISTSYCGRLLVTVCSCTYAVVVDQTTEGLANADDTDLGFNDSLSVGVSHDSLHSGPF